MDTDVKVLLWFASSWAGTANREDSSFNIHIQLGFSILA